MSVGDTSGCKWTQMGYRQGETNERDSNGLVAVLFAVVVGSGDFGRASSAGVGWVGC